MVAEIWASVTVFEIALVRLSETSDYLPGQVNNPLAVIRGTSEKFFGTVIKCPNDVALQCWLRINCL